jgi:hypothetical protein
MENPGMVLAEGVGAMDFQDLSEEYGISSVPDTIINNGSGRFVGALPEQNVLAELMRTVGK